MEKKLSTVESNNRKYNQKPKWVLTFLIILGISILSVWMLDHSEAQRVVALGQKSLLEGNPHKAVILALQAQQIANIPEAQDLLIDATNKIDFVSGKGLLGHRGIVTSLAWSPDGQLASASADGTIIIWDLVSGQPTQTLHNNKHGVNSIAWSADGRLASASCDAITIWDLTSGKPAQTLHGYSSCMNNLVWSPDGRLAANGGRGYILIWDLTSDQPTQSMSWDGHEILSMAWSADGKLASSQQGEIFIWDLENGRPAKILREHRYGVFSMDWSVSGRLASGSGSGDSSVVIWDLDNEHQPTQTLYGHSEIVWSVDWSGDGQLASGAGDGNVIIWDLSSGQPYLTLHGHSHRVTSVDWSADGQLASGSDDNIVIVWRLSEVTSTQALRSRPACEWVLRNLTINEWVETVGAWHTYQPACPNLSMETIPLPNLEEWQKATQYFDEGEKKYLNSTQYGLKNFSYTPARFLWLTWSGRFLVLTIGLLVLGLIALLVWMGLKAMGWFITLVWKRHNKK
jgi:WD40 repeat protein